MNRLLTALTLLIIGALPLEAAALWFNATGQCFESASMELEPVVSEEDPRAEGCEQDELDDPSANACFEGAEYPISILPQVIAQTQAERLTAHLVRQAADLAQPGPPEPSPDEASVEDPDLPGVPLVKHAPPKPRPTPNACSVYPEECETAPWVPTLNLEASRPAGADSHTDFVFPAPPEDLDGRRGPPNPGLAHHEGVRSRVERPPELA